MNKKLIGALLSLIPAAFAAGITFDKWVLDKENVDVLVKHSYITLNELQKNYIAKSLVDKDYIAVSLINSNYVSKSQYENVVESLGYAQHQLDEYNEMPTHEEKTLSPGESWKIQQLGLNIRMINFSGDVDHSTSEVDILLPDADKAARTTVRDTHTWTFISKEVPYKLDARLFWDHTGAYMNLRLSKT